jgi:SH3 domain
MFANARDAFLRLFKKRQLLDDLTAAIDARSPEPAIVTLVSIVFTTAPKTFAGSAVFVTGTVLPPIAQTPSLSKGGSSSATGSPRSSSVSSSSMPPPTTMATSPSANVLAVTSTPTATATAAPASSSGMSGGAKAGLAFGIILLLGLVGAFVLFMYKKRKDQNDDHQRLDDEKTFFAGGRNPDALPSHTAPGSNGVASYDSEMQSIAPRDPAPQISLRAVSQFEPAMANSSAPRVSALPPHAEAAAIAAATTAAVASATAAAASARTQQPATTAQTANNPENPFGNHAEQLGTSPPQEVPLPESPVDGAKAVEAADFPLPDTTPGTPKPAAGAAAAGAAAIAAATAAAASNKPQGSSTPTGGASENVHRVQLDFKPSMEDELELKTGETVRMLHEYDDGWVSTQSRQRQR